MGKVVGKCIGVAGGGIAVGLGCASGSVNGGGGVQEANLDEVQHKCLV